MTQALVAARQAEANGSHAPAAAPALQADGLTLRLGGQCVLDDLTLAVHAGQWLAIVGPNGAGKSTLLAVLAGLRKPDAGTVRLQGRPWGHWAPRDRAQALAWLSQQGEAEGDIAARDVVALGRLPRHGLLGAPDAADRAAVEAALAETAAAAFADRRLSVLSGGERQRVLLARALAVQAGVLLLDEPTTHLDAPHQRALCRSVQARAAAGVAVVTVLHDLNLALAADRIAVLAQGRLVADGAPGDAALRRALAAVFDEAFSIEPVPLNGRTRWVAVPAP
jgi:iron complex transport system ATP-binding protein